LARIVVLGGYGVFGGRLARRLVSETDAEIVVAGRSLVKAKAFCRINGGAPFKLDRDGDLCEALTPLHPDIVIDAAGPFQSYGDDPYRVARAAIAAGAHYLDLADDTAFVTGIGALDAVAKQAGVCVISGASSVPAVSAAALDELTAGMESVALVESVILPGNRAPRGLSVVRSIVGQAGRPLRAWRGGRWVEEPAWDEVSRFDLTVWGAAPVRTRLASPIGVPDLVLFSERYHARSVRFLAGLELKLMHLGLKALAWPVRLGLVSSLLPLSRTLKWVADRLERFGSDRGGMLVRAIGHLPDGNTVERRWTLVAEEGDGPEVPPTPAFLICRRLLDGMVTRSAHEQEDIATSAPTRDRQAPSACDAASGSRKAVGLPEGAYPAVGILSLREVEAGLAPFAIRFGREEHPAVPMLEQVLGKEARTMPAAWRRLADIHDRDHFAGEASVARGEGLLSRLVGFALGFPAASERCEVEVTKERTAHGERWTRRFDGRPFRSYLSRRPGDGKGILRERFGPLSFVIRLHVADDRVEWPIVSWRFLGLPIPVTLAPKSQTAEFVDEDGRFRFDVAISVPLVGPVVRYRGWLAPI
jgi:hypothetical protein